MGWRFRVAAIVVLLAVAACGQSGSDHVIDATGDNINSIRFRRVVVSAACPKDPWMKDVADLDGDGLQDLIVASADGPVVWYRAPEWGLGIVSQHGTSESGSAVGDLDGDGDLDIVVGKTWFENVDHGSSWLEHPLPRGTAGTHDIAVADIDGNGKADIIMRGETGSIVTIYLQTDSAKWQSFDADPGIGLNGLDVADLNGDGALDIVVGGIWMENPRASVASTPWLRHRFAADWNRYAAVKVIDIDRDGRLDVVLGVSEAKGRLSWFKQPVKATSEPWQENVIAEGLDKVHSVPVADFDGDGALDVAASEFDGDGRLIIYLGNGGTNWTGMLIGRDGLHNVRVLDVNGDGRPDLFGAAPFGVVPLILYQNTGPIGDRRALIFSKTLGFRHVSIPDGIAAIRQLGAENDFVVDASEDSIVFSVANLARYKAVIFLNPSGDILDRSQRAAFQAYIQNGGGFVGIHNASALTLEGWDWYTNLVGARYVSEIVVQPSSLEIIDGTHLSTLGLPNPWVTTTESYNWDVNPKVNGVTVLVNLDESSVNGGTMGRDHPFSWYHAYDGGRSWYTVGGADSANYRDPNFLRHILGGILYAGAF